MSKKLTKNPLWEASSVQVRNRLDYWCYRHLVPKENVYVHLEDIGLPELSIGFNCLNQPPSLDSRSLGQNLLGKALSSELWNVFGKLSAMTATYRFRRVSLQKSLPQLVQRDHI